MQPRSPGKKFGEIRMFHLTALLTRPSTLGTLAVLGTGVFYIGNKSNPLLAKRTQRAPEGSKSGSQGIYKQRKKLRGQHREEWRRRLTVGPLVNIKSNMRCKVALFRDGERASLESKRAFVVVEGMSWKSETSWARTTRCLLTLSKLSCICLGKEREQMSG